MADLLDESSLTNQLPWLGCQATELVVWALDQSCPMRNRDIGYLIAARKFIYSLHKWTQTRLSPRSGSDHKCKGRNALVDGFFHQARGPREGSRDQHQSWSAPPHVGIPLLTPCPSEEEFNIEKLRLVEEQKACGYLPHESL
eukprot:746277-Hanusia_phi.AAC.3